MKNKKLLLFFSILLCFGSLRAQTIFSEDFNGTTPLANWTLFNVDNRTPNANVGVINNAWVVIPDGGPNGTGDNAAFSTSWYTPAGAADDWMFTPAITLTNGNFLFWDANALDASFPDGYEVRISTTTATVNAGLANAPLFTIAGENASWTTRNVDLSAYAGQTVYFAWRNNSNDQFVLAVDNIAVREVRNTDVTLTELNIDNVYPNNSTVTVSGTIQNTGLNTLNSVKVNWSNDGGVTVNTDSIAVNVSSFATATFNHSITFNASNPGTFTNIDVWTSEPNNVPDSSTSGDSLRASIFVNNGVTVSKNVLLEEFTTAPCQFCPDGAVVVENILNSNPSVIGVGEHACFGTDAMTIPEASAYCAAFGSGAPTACVDRVLYPGESEVAFSRNLWATRANSQSQLGTAADVTVTGTYNATSRAVNVDVNAAFVDYVFPGDLRLTLFVVEDSVTGTGSGYNQVNFYNTQNGHPYFGAGNPILGYVHRHVLRDVYPTTDAWGQPGVIPTSPALNTTYTQNFTFNLNNAWKAEDVTLVGFVSYFNADVAQREVLNAFEIDLMNLITGLGEVKNVISDFNLFPNPSSEEATVSFNLSENSNVVISVVDIAGKTLFSENYGTMGKGNQKAGIDVSDFAQGFYFVNLNVNGTISSKKLSVIR